MRSSPRRRHAAAVARLSSLVVPIVFGGVQFGDASGRSGDSYSSAQYLICDWQ